MNKKNLRFSVLSFKYIHVPKHKPQFFIGEGSQSAGRKTLTFNRKTDNPSQLRL